MTSRAGRRIILHITHLYAHHRFLCPFPFSPRRQFIFNSIINIHEAEDAKRGRSVKREEVLVKEGRHLYALVHEAYLNVKLVFSS